MKRICSSKLLLSVLVLAFVILSAAAYAITPICPHILGWGNGISTWAQGAPWIKVIGAGDVATAKALGAKVFYRPYDAAPGNDDGCLPWSMTGTQYADYVWARLSQMPQKPEAVGYRNEFNWDSNDPSQHKRTCAEFVSYYNRLRADGYTGKIIFGSFGVGWVDSPIWDDTDVRAATDRADGIETHEYFDLSVDCCSTWLAYRHRDLAINAHPDHLGNKEWYIGEFGSDQTCQNCTECSDSQCRRGWQDRGKLTSAQFIAELDKYSKNCHPNVVAVFLFQQGSGSWWDFDVMGTPVADWMRTTWNASTGTISGSVKNSGGTGISGATVSTNTGGYSTTTNTSGNYTLTGVTTGTYNITASKSGYAPVTNNNVSVTQNQTTTSNFTLQTSTSLVSNGDFESGFGSGVGTGWSSWTSAWSNPLTFADDTSIKHGGSHAQRWGRSDNQRCHGGVYQRINVTSGHTYRINAYERFSSTDSGAWCEFGYDLTGQTSNPEATTVTYTKLESGGQNTWLTYTHDVTATGSAITIFGKFGQYNQGGAGPSWGYLDDVSVTDLGGTSTGAITGNVKNNSGVNLSGATISAGGYNATTDGSGNYTISNIAVGTYNVTASKSGYNSATNSNVSVTANTTTTSNFTLTPTSSIIASQDFESMPSWNSGFDASWGVAANWSINSGGQSGNFLQCARPWGGSSDKVLVYTVPTNTNITISLYMKCPSYTSGSYWMESAYKFGNYTAQDFDTNSGTWTYIKKFADNGTNGNNNTWTQYSVTANTGSNTQISIGYKLGSNNCTGPTVGWDTFRIQ